MRMRLDIEFQCGLDIEFRFRFFGLSFNFILYGRQMPHASVHGAFADRTALLALGEFLAYPRFALRVFAFPDLRR